MWLVNWFKSALEGLGLMNKKGKIVFLGLDDAGKTTLLLRLKEDVMKQMDPTQQPYSEELVMGKNTNNVGKVRFKAWDLGGHEAARKTWRNYVSDVDGIIYLVDSSNVKRFEESRVELQGVLEMPELQKVPIVILGNKIDKAGAVPEEELREALGLEPKGMIDYGKEKGSRPVEVFMCSVAKRMGYTDAFKWLSGYLK